MRKYPDLRRKRSLGVITRAKYACWYGGVTSMTVHITGDDGRHYSCSIPREEVMKWVAESDPKLDLVKAHTPKLGIEWIGPRSRVPKNYIVSATPLLPV